MPADGDDASPLVLGHNLLLHTVERHSVEILLPSEFQSAKVESHYGGIVAGCLEHVASSLIPFPRTSIYWIVLMSEHHTFSLQFLKPLQQVASC